MFDDDDRDYTVVINDEEQYSIWPSGHEIPAGWHEAGVTGRRSRCLEYIDGAWTDLRPKSLRERMNEGQGPVTEERGRRPSGVSGGSLPRASREPG